MLNFKRKQKKTSQLKVNNADKTVNEPFFLDLTHEYRTVSERIKEEFNLNILNLPFIDRVKSDLFGAISYLKAGLYKLYKIIAYILYKEDFQTV